MSDSPVVQQVVIVSGMSGAGKSTALNALEDMGFYCVDNLPPALLSDFTRHVEGDTGRYAKVALGIDARAPGEDLSDFPDWLQALRRDGLDCRLLFLNADDAALLQRFSETRRRHPMSRGQHVLTESITRERDLLEPIRQSADWELDTSDLNIHQLRHQTWKCVGPESGGMTVVVQSFAFKNGVPGDVDFVFDARSLPNPHWKPELRAFSGRDREVSQWLERHAQVQEFADDILAFLLRWLPGFQEAQSSYVTIGIGCTGGRHRSVYLADRLAGGLRSAYPEVMVHHREMKK